MERKKSGVESGMIISSAVFVQRRLRVGGEMTFCSIKTQLFYFCSMVTLHLFLSRCMCVCLTWGEVQGGHISLDPWAHCCSLGHGLEAAQRLLGLMRTDKETLGKKRFSRTCAQSYHTCLNTGTRVPAPLIMLSWKSLWLQFSGCLVSLLLCLPFLRCMWRSVRQLEEWFQDDMTKQQQK